MAALVNLGGKARHRLNFPANVPGHGGERRSFHHEEDPEQQVQYPIGNRGEICPEIDRKGDADKAARDTQPQSGNGLMVSAKMIFCDARAMSAFNPNTDIRKHA